MSVFSFLKPGARQDSDFRSAVARLIIWFFSFIYIGLGAFTGYYQVSLFWFFGLFLIFLAVFIALLARIARQPKSRFRPYLTLFVDVAAISLAIALTQHAASPFYLLYIWMFIFYGTRDGKTLLAAASVASVLCYSIVLTLLGEWEKHYFEAVLFLLLLIALPFYQCIIRKKSPYANLLTEQMYAETKAANQAKGEFLDRITHELRAPLGGVIGMTRLLETTKLSQEQQQYVASLSTSASTLQGLVDDGLDLSKLEARKLEPERSPFDLRQSVYEVCMAMGNKALEKGLELICELDQQLPAIVVGDDLRCRQVLYNLIENAIKFTNRGEVIVRGRVSAADQYMTQLHVALEVQDTGKGISQPQLEQMFDSFWPADGCNASAMRGTGLGTAIARDITQLMGGVISVESELGRGSLFRVKLPIISDSYHARDSLPDFSDRGRTGIICESSVSYRELLVKICTAMGINCEAAANSGQLHAIAENLDDPSVLAFLLVSDSPGGRDLRSLVEIIHTEFRLQVPVIYLMYPGRHLGLDLHSGARLYKPFLPRQLSTLVERCLNVVPKPAAKSSPVSARMGQDADLNKVLVAEDNSVSAQILAAFLNRLGYGVTIVKNGRQALDKLGSDAFSAVIVDLSMPEMDGIAFTRNYRAGEREDRHLPIIAVTASTEEDVRMNCLAAGMDDFLTKPVIQQHLELVMRRHTRLADQVDQGRV